MRPRPRPRSGASKVPAGPRGWSPAGCESQSESEIVRADPGAGQPGARGHRDPGVEIAAAPGLAWLPRRGRNVAAASGARTARPAPSPWLHQKAGGGGCIKEVCPLKT